MITVVVPTLDEEVAIDACLAQFPDDDGVEVVVVDGGSRDRTAQRVRALPWVRLVETERGRGRQMNAGARAATGDVLLFLHADTRLPAGWAAAVRASLRDPCVVGGWFRLRTACPERGPLANLALRLCDLRPNLLGQPWGDCAFFARRAVFARLGGYRDIPLMEDCDFAARLARQGAVARLPLAVTTSGRRFVARPVRSTLATMFFPLLFRLGVSPRTLDRLYGVAR